MLLGLRLRGTEKDARLVAVLAALAWVNMRDHVVDAFACVMCERTKSLLFVLLSTLVMNLRCEHEL